MALEDEIEDLSFKKLEAFVEIIHRAQKLYEDDALKAKINESTHQIKRSNFMLKLINGLEETAQEKLRDHRREKFEKHKLSKKWDNAANAFGNRVGQDS